MDKDIKITLSLFLTWLVFGLFNLFGQPQAFVPPIIVDGLMVVGLGIYFCFPFRKNLFYFCISIFTLYILMLSSVELGWISLNEKWIYVILIFTFLLSILLIAATVLNYDKFQLLSIIGIIVSVSFTLSFMYSLFPKLGSQLFHPFYLYLVGGISAIFGVFLLNKNKSTQIEFKRILLLLSLNFLFDIGNYLALLALAK